jgi:hypothetical protein
VDDRPDPGKGEQVEGDHDGVAAPAQAQEPEAPDLLQQRGEVAPGARGCVEDSVGHEAPNSGCDLRPCAARDVNAL